MQLPCLSAGSKFRSQFSAKSAMLRLGIHECAGDEIAGARLGHAGAAGIQPKIQDCPARLRAAVAHRPPNYGLDGPAHGPFVHQSWFWRSEKAIHEKANQFEPIPNGFRMSKHSPSTKQPAVSVAEENDGRARDHDDRLRLAQHAL
jgi:hypothetical protein